MDKIQASLESMYNSTPSKPPAVNCTSCQDISGNTVYIKLMDTPYIMFDIPMNSIILKWLNK